MTRQTNFILCALATIFVSASVLPGSLSDDAVYMMFQLVDLKINDHHSPLYTFLLGMLLPIYNGPLLPVFLNIVTYFITVYFLVEIIRQRSHFLGYLVLALALTPLCLYELHYVQKDVLMRNALLGAIVACYWFVARSDNRKILPTIVLLSFAIAGRVTGFVLAIPFAMYMLGNRITKNLVGRSAIFIVAIATFCFALQSVLNAINYDILQAKKVAMHRHFYEFVQCPDIFVLHLRSGNPLLDVDRYRDAIEDYWGDRTVFYAYTVQPYCVEIEKALGLDRGELWRREIMSHKSEYIRHHLSTYWKYWNGDGKHPLRYKAPRVWQSTLPEDHELYGSYEPPFPVLRFAYFNYLEHYLERYPSTIYLFVFGLFSVTVFLYQVFVQGKSPVFFSFIGTTAMTLSTPLLLFTGGVEPRYMFASESLLLLAIPFALYELPYFKKSVSL